MTYHHGAHPIVSELKQLYVGREVLRNQVVVRQTYDRHLFMRIDLAGPDAGKMFQTPDTPGSLHAAHVNRRIAQYFAGRAPEGPRIQSVREQVALLGHDRHHGREIQIEAQQPQHLSGDAAQRPRGCQVTMLAYYPGRRHWGGDLAQSINQAAFLIDAEERLDRHHCAYLIEQAPQLIGRSYVATEYNHAARLDLFDQTTRFRIKLNSRESNEKELSDLLFERQGLEIVQDHLNAKAGK